MYYVFPSVNKVYMWYVEITGTLLYLTLPPCNDTNYDMKNYCVMFLQFNFLTTNRSAIYV